MLLTLRAIGFIGVLLFSIAFGFTFSVPEGVEEIAANFLKHKIEEEAQEKIDSFALAAKDSKLGQLAMKLAKGKEQEIAELKKKLKENIHEKASEIIAQMQDLSCECRQKYASAIKQILELRVFSLQSANEKILDFMKAKYMETVNKLVLDLRIFTGVNSVIFLMLLILSFLKTKATVHLLLPAILLAGSTLICSYFYFFEQNWFFTIIYNDYLGFAYLAYVGGLFSIFLDIAFNKAQISTQIINFISSIFGSAFAVLPC